MRIRIGNGSNSILSVAKRKTHTDRISAVADFFFECEGSGGQCRQESIRALNLRPSRINRGGGGDHFSLFARAQHHHEQHVRERVDAPLLLLKRSMRHLHPSFTAPQKGCAHLKIIMLHGIYMCFLPASAAARGVKGARK